MMEIAEKIILKDGRDTSSKKNTLNLKSKRTRGTFSKHIKN